MKDELFQQLAASLKEGAAMLRGKKKLVHSTTLQRPDPSGPRPATPDAKSVREKLGLSQNRLSPPISNLQSPISNLPFTPRTLQNWEQGHRRPEGNARALLRVAKSHPQAVLEALHRWAYVNLCAMTPLTPTTIPIAESLSPLDCVQPAAALGKQPAAQPAKEPPKPSAKQIP